MNKVFKVIGVLLLFMTYLIGIIYWFEAEKEVRILCGMFQKGQPVEAVEQTLATGNLLYYKKGHEDIVVNSGYTLNSTECTIYLSGVAKVTNSMYSQSFRLERVTGGIAAVLTFVVAVFQLLLAFGAPWGEWAWGGQQTKLTEWLRFGSFTSFLLLSFGAFAVFSSIDVIPIIPPSIFRIVTPLYTLLFLGSIIGNFNSKSEKERKVMLPISIILFCTYLIVCIYMFG